MNLNRLSLFALLGLTGLSVGTAQAAFITYTDEATFLSLLQPGYFQDKFNDVANGGTSGGITGASSTRTGGGFSVTYTAPSAGLFSTAGGMSTANVLDNLVATLNGSNIYAVGGYFFLTDGNGDFQSVIGESVTAFASNGIDDNALLSVTVNSATNFFGWISTTPITTVTMNSGATSGPNYWNTLDNFIVGARKDGSDPVPAPGTLALLALGGAGLIRRRKRVA